MAADLSRRALLLAALQMAVIKAEARGDVKPLAGAIRWDAWWPDSPYSGGLLGSEWSQRLPAFTKERDGQLCICGSDKQNIENEIALARKYGVDYFVFDYFYPVGAGGKPVPSWNGMRQAYENYLSIKQSDVKFALNFDASVSANLTPKDRENVSRELSSSFADSRCVKTRDNRPVIFCMMFKEKLFLDNEKTADEFSQFLDGLTQQAAEAGSKRPYYVVLNFSAAKAQEIMKRFPFDAVSSYANPRGDDPNGKGREMPFADCAKGSRWYWEQAKTHNLPLVPPITTGWDYRPFLDLPETAKGRSKAADYCAPADAEELYDLFLAGLTTALQNKVFPSALIYAWNEYGEGGFIAPTRGQGEGRLEALKRAKARFA